VNIRYLLPCLFLLCVTLPAAAEGPVRVLSLEEGAVPPAARIGDISWLVGRWVGEGLGGEAEDVIAPAADGQMMGMCEAEDVIAPAADGQMMGMFRHSKADGSVNFYEFYVFAERDGSLTQRLKHFSPMLSAWEEKDEFVEFPLVAIEERAAWFDGLTYVLAEGRLTVGVRIAEEQFAYFYYRKAD
jgi:hypothetical protein